jgi:type II secretory ATPase GspE/PulE/Tfp pilus assembly ATPase PilB-like protein
MLCRYYLAGALGGCYAAEVDASLVTFVVFTTLLATDVSSSCTRLSWLGDFRWRVSPHRVFLLFICA